MSEKLFREEVVKARSDRLCGDLIISQPLTLRVLTGLFAGIVLLGIIFLINNTYTRKQTVSGMLVPDKGVVEVFPSVAGRVEHVWVEQGDTVIAGQLLFRISIDQCHNGATLVPEALGEILATERSLLESQLQQEEETLALDLERHEHTMEGLRKSLQQEQSSLDAELSILALHRKAQARAVELQSKGAISEAGLDDTRLRVLSQQALVKRQESSVLSLQNALLEGGGERDSLLQTFQQRRISLQQSLNELSKRQVQHNASRTLDISAPIDGRIGRLAVHLGHQVEARQPVLSVLPSNSQLQAQLQVPASAMGFIQEGQSIRIRYSAYAYQKFGVQEGVIVSIAESALIPNAEGSPPVYQVIANLDAQQMLAYGEDIPLRAGSSLTADIILDKRNLLEWLLEPLYSLKGSL